MPSLAVVRRMFALQGNRMLSTKVNRQPESRCEGLKLQFENRSGSSLYLV